jgi:hydrogenase maturation protease
METKKRYIAGLGNYAMMDDSIGLRVVEYIQDNDLMDGFDIIEVKNDGMLLLTHFTEDVEMIVVIDSARMGKAPGEFMVFSPEEVRSRKAISHISTHEGDILKLIELASQMDLSIPEIKILAIEPKSMEAEMGLSEPLQDRFMEYVEAAIEEVNKK